MHDVNLSGASTQATGALRHKLASSRRLSLFALATAAAFSSLWAESWWRSHALLSRTGFEPAMPMWLRGVLVLGVVASGAIWVRIYQLIASRKRDPWGTQEVVLLIGMLLVQVLSARLTVLLISPILAVWGML